ncbi:MAG: hypothetical protein HZA17_10860 [Nitrospirae bacterium]|nr:hypothetical protein [Nitrospirota bacterium]
MVKLKNLIISSEALAACAAFIVTYVCLGLSGIFSSVPSSLMKILHKPPALIGLLFLLVIIFVRLLIFAKARSTAGQNGVSGILFYMGIILTIIGILVSSQMRFEGRIYLPEGESFSGDARGYIEGSVYAGKRSFPPAMKLHMTNISPFFRGGRFGSGSIASELLYTGVGNKYEKKMKINSAVPVLADGVFFRIRSFGYAPFYRLTDSSGKLLDEAYPMLRLFPPGAEDSFRVEKQPYTFYMKYYPDRAVIRDKKIPIPEQGKGGLYKLRVARNLEVVFNGYVVPNEIYQVDSTYISFEDLRKWAEIEIVKDYGIFMIAPGLLMIFVSILLGWRRKTNVPKEVFGKESVEENR